MGYHFWSWSDRYPAFCLPYARPISSAVFFPRALSEAAALREN